MPKNSYTMPTMRQKADTERYLTAVAVFIFLVRSISDVNNVTYIPFLDIFAVVGGGVDNFAVEIHSSRAAAVKIVGGDSAEIKHKLSHFFYRNTAGLFCPSVAYNKNIMKQLIKVLKQ